MDGVSYLGNAAFSDCKSLEDIGTPSLLTEIPDYAFSRCEKLKKADFPSVTKVGNYAFSNCHELSEINYPSLTIVRSFAFKDCYGLSEINLPNLKKVEGGSFAFCKNLKSLFLPLCETIDDMQWYYYSTYNSERCGAFDGCTHLLSVVLPQVSIIGSYAFRNCSNLHDINIPKVSTIRESAFGGCNSLTDLNLPEVKVINEGAFHHCSSILQLVLPNVETIDKSAFSYCLSLKKLDLPNVKSIGASTFLGCDNLENPVISSTNLTNISSDAFPSVVGTITLMSTTPAVLSGNSAFGMNTVLVPDSAVEDYRNAENWKDFAIRIFGQSTIIDYNVNVNALSNHSALHDAIGEENLNKVVSLKITGDINGYDIMVLRNKTDNLHFLDLTDANIVANAYEYMSGKHSQNDVMDGLSGLKKLSSVKLPKSIKSIASDAFSYCTNLKSIEFQSGLETIGSYAFQRCNSLYTVFLKEGLKSIEDYAFCSSGISDIICPKSLRSIGQYAFQSSSLRSAQFQEGLETIGSYAFNDCSNLDTLELKKGLKSIGKHAFYNSSIKEIILPEGLESIDYYAFGGTSLNSITLPEGLLSIGQEAFRECSSLKRVIFPSTLESLGYRAFRNCSTLDSIILLGNLRTIADQAFYGCSNLKIVTLPNELQSIESSAFWGCKIEQLHLPSSLTSIGQNAFYNNNLQDVYAYVVEPISIYETSFSNYQNATLHVPTTSYYNYWYHPQWSQFRKVVEFDAEYDYFYLNNDFVISKEKGTVQGDSINTDLYMTSGLIIETDSTDKQMLNEMRVNVNGNQGASIITDNNLSVNKMYYDVAVTGGRWYFLSFPFRVSLSNVTAPEPNVWRYYDSSQRALGRTGWKNWTADYLNANQGYIFQASESGTLTVAIEQDKMDWHANNRPIVMAYHQAEDRQNASWNFLGNPHTGYYDIESTGYDQPFTVWNGSSYDAVRAGDDVFALTPLQAFFVQKADNQAQINFPAEGRYTYSQWQQVRQSKMEARRMKEAGMERQIVDLTLSDGEVTDKTRVVYNKQKSQEYELDCDAAKFLAAGVPQLYTIDNDQCLYAINERPLGEVRLGYMAAKQGFMTISALRMEQPVLLRDNLLQLTHDLSASDYSFHTEAGTFDERFTLILDASTTGIAQLRQQTGVSVMAEQGGISLQGIGEEPVSIYSLGGTQIVGQAANGFVQLPKATYLVKVGNNTTKVIVK